MRPAMRAYRLYNARTQATIKRQAGRGMSAIFAGVSVLAGGLLLGGHMEEPILADALGACEGVELLVDCEYPAYYDWIAGLLGLVGMGLFAALMFRIRRAPLPTLFCEGCDGAGWVRDLEPAIGRCPRCRHDRFTFVERHAPSSSVASPIPLHTVVEQHVRGRDLIDRARGLRWFDSPI